MNSSFPGNIQERRNRGEDQQHSVLMLSLPGPPHYKALMPAILPGTRCYTDASIAPDNLLQVSSSAGLGIFIVNNLPGAASTIFIKAKQRGCNSVLMAEAAALALGAQLLNALHVHQPFFLSDNQLLVNFFNGKDHTNPPQWDIKLFTQSFINIISANEGKIFKIDRKLNITAHVLASQTYKSTVRTSDEFHATCTNPLHVNSCLAAINSVLGESFTLIAASLQSTLATSQQSST